MIGNSWLHRKVRAFYGTDHSETRIEGKVVAYSGSPMVLIEAEDGTKEWWGVELVEVLEDEFTIRWDIRDWPPRRDAHGRLPKLVMPRDESGNQGLLGYVYESDDRSSTA